MTNRAQVEINLDAIVHNVAMLKKSSGTPLMAVVKADAYGHGLIPVANTCLQAGAQWLGVALLEEAITLRESGIQAPILSWLVPPGSDFQRAIELDIDLGVASIKIFREVMNASKKVGKKARIHIEVDTGMTRGGFLDEWDAFLDLLSKDKEGAEIVGLFSHFARADEPGEPQNAQQLKRFFDS